MVKGTKNILLEISRIKIDILEGRTTINEAIEQFKYIDYHNASLYNALYSSNPNLYIN